jgi:hypothetical protein
MPFDNYRWLVNLGFWALRAATSALNSSSLM